MRLRAAGSTPRSGRTRTRLPGRAGLPATPAWPGIARAPRHRDRRRTDPRTARRQRRWCRARPGRRGRGRCRAASPPPRTPRAPSRGPPRAAPRPLTPRSPGTCRTAGPRGWAAWREPSRAPTTRQANMTPGAPVGSPRMSVARWGLPELEPGAFRIDRPSEAPVLRLLHRIDDLDPGRAQLGEHRVQIGDAEVHHERLLRPSEVLGVLIEDRPGRGTARRPLERLASPVGEVDAQMLGVPALKARGLSGALEHPADPGDSLHGVTLRQRPGREALLVRQVARLRASRVTSSRARERRGAAGSR